MMAGLFFAASAVMAQDKLLPARLSALHPRLGTPYVSIIICALIVSVMVLWSFGDLLIIDITVYFAGLVLEFLSLVVLRISKPGMPRPFHIPFHVGGLLALVLLPTALYFFALSDIIAKSNDALKPVFFALLLLLSAPVAWWAVKIGR